MYRHDWRLLRLAGRNGPDLMPPEVLGEPIADAIGSARAHSRSNFPQQVRLLRHSDGLRFFGYQLSDFIHCARQVAGDRCRPLADIRTGVLHWLTH